MARKITGFKLSTDDLDELDRLVELLGTTSRAEAVRQAVRWYRMWLEAQRVKMAKRS